MLRPSARWPRLSVAVPPPTGLERFLHLEPFILSQAHHNFGTRQDLTRAEVMVRPSIVASSSVWEALELQHGVRAKEPVV